MSAALFCFWGSCRRPLWIVIRLLLPVGNSVPARLVRRQAACSSRGPKLVLLISVAPSPCFGLTLELLRHGTGCIDILRRRS